MNVIVFFINVGFYHAARISSTNQSCQPLGWNLHAVQLTDDTLEHPWGDAQSGLGVPLTTLVQTPSFPGQSSGQKVLPVVSAQVVAEHFSALKPDVIFLAGWSFDVCRKIWAWARRNGVPVVVMSESKRDDAPRAWWKELLKSHLYIRRFDAALVGGEKHRQYVHELGMPKAKIFTGYDAVDNMYFQTEADFARQNQDLVRSHHPKIPERPFLISAFRFIPRKNAIRLLNAYCAYKERFGSAAWDLVVCGSGEQREQLEQISAQQGLSESVHFVGFVPYSEVGKWYGLAQGLVHPAIQEQWGLVINEACAAGIPVLCSETVGAAPDLVRHRENGFLFDPLDEKALLKALTDLHSASESERLKMGEVSRQLVARCSPEVFGQSFVAAAKAATGRG